MPSSALILGASGRIGRMLRHHGLDGVAPVWQYRRAVDHANAVVFDPLKESPELGRYDTVLCLAGAISGTASALRSNRDLADAALDIGVACGAKRVFLASSAAVFRYRRIEDFGEGALFDRSFGLHYRLVDEGRIRPALAVSLRDFAGNGIFSSECVVASKTLTPDLDVA